MSAPLAAKPRGPRPVLIPECCKGCGRCIESCARHCIEEGLEIHSATGLVPVRLHLEDCTSCGLCFDACPEHGSERSGQKIDVTFRIEDLGRCAQSNAAEGSIIELR